jgi:hypothetical protein
MRCLGQFGAIGLFVLFGLGSSFFREVALYASPILLPLGGVLLGTSRFGKARYVPAMVSVEGGGIKRGLTAPEAAALLEVPAEKVASMVVFGLAKKNMIKVSGDPPTFDVLKPPEPAPSLHEYETMALIKLKDSKVTLLSEVDLGPVVKEVVRLLVQRMAGHNVEETKEYYRQIVSRAWEEVKEAGLDEAQYQKKVEEKVDWMLLDPNFGTRFRPVETRYRTSGSTGGSGLRIPDFSGSGGTGPGIGNVAAGFAGWMENTAGSIAAKVAPAREGLIDLSGLDRAMASKGGSGGGRSSGGGGSCACACAGCACACACAGGGR